MYFKATLTINPDSLTQVNIVKPEGTFKKFFFSLTGGRVGDQQVEQTFKAISIIQQIYHAFEGVGINNIVRLNHDDLDIYFDKDGKKDDFSYAIDQYTIEIDDSMSTYFNRLWMVLEHEDASFKYLVEVSINRNHNLGEYPIEILISAFIKDTAGAKNKEGLSSKMDTVFASQENYDAYLSKKQAEFDHFVSFMILELKKSIRVKDIREKIRARMVRQKHAQEVQRTEKPVYGGAPYEYYGFNDFLLSAILWSTLCHDTGMHISNVEVIDETGEYLTNIDEAGIDAADSAVLDGSVDSEEAMAEFSETPDLDVGGGDELKNVVAGDDTDSGGWFDFDGDFDFDF